MPIGGLCVPVAPTLSGGSAVPVVADGVVTGRIPRGPLQCDKSHDWVHGAASRTSTCTEWCSSCLSWWS